MSRTGNIPIEIPEGVDVSLNERNVIVKDKSGEKKFKFSQKLEVTIENKQIVMALNACGANVGFVEINSDKGHDSFLLEVPEFLKTLSEFLNSAYKEINNEKRI